MSNPTKRAAFLFGSGISFKSFKSAGREVPDVARLTEQVLEGAWKHHTGGRFSPLPQEEGIESTGEARRVQDFLRALKNEIEPPLRAKGHFFTNYEDLYAAALQIWQHEACIVNNPLLAKGVDFVKASTCHLHLRGADDYPPGRADRFSTLAERATDFVQWVVFSELWTAPKPQGLNVLQDVAKTAKAVDIFTLNHDCLVEETLRLAGIHLRDGFGKPKSKRRVFSGKWGRKKGVCLLKLHGSIDWFAFAGKDPDKEKDLKLHGSSDRFSFGRSGGTVEYASVAGPAEYLKDKDGEHLPLLDIKPLFLSGTTVKERSYGTGLMGDIFAEFRSRLRHHKTLICCGYGWGDAGINRRIGEWFATHDHRLVILHKGPPDTLLRDTSFGCHLEDHQRTKKIVVIKKWLDQCTVDDLEPYFDT